MGKAREQVEARKRGQLAPWGHPEDKQAKLLWDRQNKKILDRNLRYLKDKEGEKTTKPRDKRLLARGGSAIGFGSIRNLQRRVNKVTKQLRLKGGASKDS